VGGVFLLGVGFLVLGLVVMAVWNARAPEFFRGETLEPMPGSGAVAVLPAQGRVSWDDNEGALP
jgi:hypothetical protein